MIVGFDLRSKKSNPGERVNLYIFANRSDDSLKLNDPFFN